MFGNTRRRIPISKDDIKKAVRKANDRLKAQNSKIESNIKDASSKLKVINSDIKSAVKEFNDYTSKIDSRISECTAIEQQLMGLKSDLTRMSDNFAKELAIEESLQSSIIDFQKKEKSLHKSVALLETKKENAKSINAELKSSKANYDAIKKDLAKLKSDKEIILDKTKKAIITKDIAEENSVKAVNSLEEVKLDVAEKIKDMDSMLKETTDYFNSETGRLDSIIAERLEEIETNTGLANMKVKEYEVILTKVIGAENKIKNADQKVADILKYQEDSIANIKKKFETWKLMQLDQVSKLKLKGKIENIDKAGLRDILGE